MAIPKPKSVVVDSSVIVKWLHQTDELRLEEANALFDDWEAGKVEIIAPELAKYEVGNALLHKHLEIPALLATLDTFYAMPISYVVQSKDAAEQTAEIAKRDGITYYDATFIQVAQQSGAVLITDNPKHQKSFQTVRVVALADYRPSK